MAIIDSLKDKLGTILYPKTVIKAVYDSETHERLDNILANLTANEGATYTAGSNIQINEDNVISATDNDTITSINGKTGAITKADIVALGIPSQDTVYTHPATHSISEVSGLQTTLDGKVDDSQVLTNVPLNAKFTDTIVDISGKVDNSRVLTDVPANAKFTDTVYSHPTSAGNKHIPTGGASGQVLKYSASGTATWQADSDTITTINGKTGAISKADIVALGIPAQDTDTVYSHPATHPASMITGLPTSLPADGGDADTVNGFTVGVNVPSGAKFTDTVYTHPATHPASMITDLPTSLPANGGDADTVNGFTVGTNVPVGAKFTDNNTTYSEITTAEIDAGTASTKRTVSGRRFQYALDKAYSYVDSKVLTDVPTGAKFTDTVYSHPSTHPASMITDLPTSLPANGGDADTVNGFTVGVNVPAGAKFTDTVYSHPTSAGNKHIPTGGASGQVLKYSASGTATWQADEPVQIKKW